jgi:hypothetical protein
VGELFSSFEESWRYFLQRTEPLEGFFDDFPDDEDAFLEGWLVEPSDEVKEAAKPIQGSLSRFPWLSPVPDHFLHVWIGLGHRIGDAWEGWRELESFPVEYARVNCFHAAVVVEVSGGPLRQLVAGTPNDLPTFLPHMTVAVTREPASPEPLRDVLMPLRDTVLGRQVVGELKRVRFPAGRRTLYRPWSEEQLVPLG